MRIQFPDVQFGLALAIAGVAACGGHARVATPAPAQTVPIDTAPRQAPPPTPAAAAKTEPVLPPQQAFLAGMMPLRTTGVDTFRLQHPTFDGRGVIIGILDSGIDPGLPGFRSTSTGDTKLLDLRDFSAEGRVDLRTVTPGADGSVTIGSHTLTGFGRIARLATPPYYGGVLRELPLGPMPASDLNANGRNTDDFPVVVAKSTTGWFVVTDAHGDGSLDDDVPLYDYSVSGQTFSYAPAGEKGAQRGLTIAVNLYDEGTRPLLDFFFDNSGHGSHVAGIAAGHGMFSLNGFDGVAPGAQLLGIKISNDARGGISVTGSMLRAMNYAADYAQRRGLPLVLNLSFGVGNDLEGGAAIDSLVDEFALKHPGVLFVISAGNDGPGLSTVGFPGSASFALTACALFPGVFAQPPDAEPPAPPDVMGWWSARGGELAKPDLCAPGVAYSNIPPWHIGEEISGGTSMAAPQLSGMAALLQSALSQQGGRVARAVDLKQAMISSARPMNGASAVDQGAGIPNVGAAYRWLVVGHQSGIYRVQSRPDGGNTSHAEGAYRRAGLASSADTVQRFTISSVGGQPAARLLLRSDAPWLVTQPSVDFHGGPETVTVTYDPSQLKKPGLYSGMVWARIASDTLAGPVLGLVNTVVVPWPEDEPLKVRETLGPGKLSRYFFNLTSDGGGLTAHLSMADPRLGASLYVFEPDGKPFRGGSSVDAGGSDSANVTVRVNTEDVVPGVYELAVLAPPNSPTRYTLEVSRPRIAVLAGQAPGEVAIKNLKNNDVSARVDFETEGAARDAQLSGSGSRPATAKFTSPRWADRMVVDVSLPPKLWNAVTDFGLTVFDPEGQMLSEGPMNYPFTRQVVKLDSARRGATLEVELFPAFAHLTPVESWNAHLRVTYFAPKPERIRLANDSSRTISALASIPVTLPGDSVLAPPEGFRPVVRITATPDDGVPSVRREMR